MKKIFSLVFALLVMAPMVAFATPVSWDKVGSVLQPLRTSFTDVVKVSSIVATSSATSTFPKLSISGRFGFAGISGTTWSSFCTAITGGAGLCDGNDAAGSGTSGLSTTTPWTTGNLAYVKTNSSVSSVATGTLTETVSGLQFDATRALVGGAAVLSLSSGFNIPSSTLLSNLGTFYTTPSSRITAGNGLSWSSNTLNCLSSSGSVFGCLAAADWTSFNGRIASSAIDTSAELKALVTDETGSGALVFASSPALTTPDLGTPSALTLTNATGLPLGGLTGLGAGVSTWLGTPTTANLAAAVTGETGSGAVVFGTAPTLASTTISGILKLSSQTASRALFTDAQSRATTTSNSAALLNALTDETGTGVAVFGTGPTITLANGTGLPISTGVSGLGTGIATWLATPSSANLLSAMTDKTGTGLLVFGTNPAFTTPNLGTPSAVTLTNGTGLPVGGLTGLGTGVGTWLGTPTTANLAAAVTGETGTGAVVFGTAPTMSSTTITGILKVSSQTAARALFTDAQSRATTTALSATILNSLTDETGTGVAVFGTGPTVSSSTLTNRTRIDNASTTNLSMKGKLRDVTGSVGTLGQCLTSTATSTFWKACGGSTDVSVRVKQSGVTSITSSWVAAAFAAEDFDTSTMHDNVTNNTRITIGTTGKYAVGGCMNIPANAVAGARVLLNGTTVLAQQKQGNSGSPEGACVSTIYSFTATDFIELQGYAGTTNNSSGDLNTNFWAYKLF